MSEKPNAYITYHVGVSSKIRSTPVTTSIGFGTGFYGGYGGLGVQTGSDIEEYQQGKVVLDILDSNKNWSGAVSAPRMLINMPTRKKSPNR